MIGYNKTWLANLRLQNELRNDVSLGYITDSEFTVIAQKHPVGFYTPNVFARIGLFILTCVVVLFADGLLSLMAYSGRNPPASGWAFFLGALTYAGLELMVSQRHHYKSGVDDALLIIAGGQFIAGFAFLLSDNQTFPYLTLSAIFFMLCLYLTLRFADMLATAITCLAFFAVVFFGFEKTGSTGLLIIPFVMIAFSGFIYWFAYKFEEREEFIDYRNCLVVTQVVSLLVLYAAGNYFVVQTLSDMLNGHSLPNTGIRFGAFFWAFTIAMPFVYIASGLRKKNVVLLRTGLLLIAAAAITFRNYYHLLPVDVALTAAGIIILGLIYGVTRYLKTPKHGFTAEETDQRHLMDNLKVESLIIAETFAHTPQAPIDSGSKFGGGDFGGGGASGGF